MKLSELFGNPRIEHFHGKKARLKIDIELDNGESRKRGDEVSVLFLDISTQKYHIEHNEFACKVSRNEIIFL